MKKNNADAQTNRLPFYKCFKRNMGNINKLCPSYIPVAVIFTFMERSMPFLYMILGAQIVDMLVNRADQKEIMKVAAVMVCARLFMELIRCAAVQLLQMNWQLVSHRKNRDIGYKAMSMDYDILEKNSTLELIAQADANTDKMGGMGEYLLRTLDLFGSVLSCIGAVVTMAGLFLVTPYHGEGVVYGFFASPVSYVLLLGLLAVSIYVGSKCEAKQGKIRYNCDQIEVKKGRIYWFFFLLINNYSMGKDIRIFKMFDVVRRKGIEARDKIESAQKQAIRDTAEIGAWAQIAQNLFIVVVYAYVGIKAIYGMITIGEVTKYISAITLLQTQISVVFSHIIHINTQNIYLESYNEQGHRGNRSMGTDCTKSVYCSSLCVCGNQSDLRHDNHW